MSDLEIEMPIWHHIEELRHVLYRSLICILAGFLIAFCFYKPLIGFLLGPLPQVDIILVSPVEGMASACKVCFWISLVGTSPLWLYWILQFLAPGLRTTERRLILPFLALSGCFILIGFAFAYLITIPSANAYFLAFNEGIGTNLWSLSHYLDYTLFIFLANGLAFEIAVIGFFLVHLGVLSNQAMRAKRRHFILVAFILAAILTPPDVFSQVMMAIPLIILYEATILYAYIRERWIIQNVLDPKGS